MDDKNITQEIEQPKNKGGRPKKKSKYQLNAGRPTSMTPETVRKLEEAFALGCSDLEACLMADISRATFYKYIKENPEFIDRRDTLRENPVLIARQTVIREMQLDGNLAFKFLERRKKDEFGVKQDLNLTGGDGGAIEQKIVVEYVRAGEKQEAKEE